MSGSAAVYWGLPSHGVALKRCRSCYCPVLVRTVLGAPGRAPQVIFFDEFPDQDVGGGVFHEHQPSPDWVWRWDEYVKKTRLLAHGREGMGVSTRGRLYFSGRDAARTRGTRIRTPDGDFVDSPYVELDHDGEHYTPPKVG